MSDFTPVVALSIIESEDRFPICFDDAVEWLGYSSKQKARNKLVNHFETGIDYTIAITQMVKSDNHAGLSVQEQGALARKSSIRLTINCFKQLGMMAGTEKGKQIRRYFLECEEIAQHMLARIEGQFAAISDRLAAIEAKVDQSQSPKLKPKQLRSAVERTEAQIAQEKQEIIDFMQRYRAR
jgi:anti-repressor protein